MSYDTKCVFVFKNITWYEIKSRLSISCFLFHAQKIFRVLMRRLLYFMCFYNGRIVSYYILIY
jgi:hypothetical protein